MGDPDDPRIIGVFLCLREIAPGQNHTLYIESAYSGRDQIQLPITNAARIGAADQGQGAKINATTMLTANAALAANLPLRLIAPRSRQLTMCGPKVGCPSSRASSFGLLRAKQ
jgi:hypothetical protein